MGGLFRFTSLLGGAPGFLTFKLPYTLNLPQITPVWIPPFNGPSRVPPKAHRGSPRYLSVPHSPPGVSLKPPSPALKFPNKFHYV